MEWINAFRSSIKSHVAVLTKSTDPLKDSVRDILKDRGEPRDADSGLLGVVLKSPRGTPTMSPRGSVACSTLNTTSTTTMATATTTTSVVIEMEEKLVKEKEDLHKDGKDNQEASITPDTSPTKPEASSVGTFKARGNAEKRNSIMGTLKEVMWFGSMRKKSVSRNMTGEEVKSGVVWREDKHHSFQQHQVVLKGTVLVLNRISKKVHHTQ